MMQPQLRLAVRGLASQKYPIGCTCRLALIPHLWRPFLEKVDKALINVMKLQHTLSFFIFNGPVCSEEIYLCCSILFALRASSIQNIHFEIYSKKTTIHFEFASNQRITIRTCLIITHFFIKSTHISDLDYHTDFLANWRVFETICFIRTLHLQTAYGTFYDKWRVHTVTTATQSKQCNIFCLNVQCMLASTHTINIIWSHPPMCP